MLHLRLYICYVRLRWLRTLYGIAALMILSVTRAGPRMVRRWPHYWQHFYYCTFHRHDTYHLNDVALMKHYGEPTICEIDGYRKRNEDIYALIAHHRVIIALFSNALRHQ